MLAVLVSAVLAGGTRTTSVDGQRLVQVALTEYHVAPQSLRALPGTLTLLVHNYGRLRHNLVISLDGHPEAATLPIPPGQTGELIATLSPGRYLMASTVLSDQALGAYGTLVVTR